MIKHYLLSPGPTPIPNQIALAMSETMIHHRTPQFNQVFEEARQGLKKLFGTKNDVLMLASSGTGAMEAAVANLFSPGDKVLVINGGKFGERWLNISNAFGLNPIEMKVPWGQAAKVAAVEKQLKANPDLQGVMIQASETSTTVFHPVQEIAKLTKNGPLFLVDGVTAVGVTPVPMDEWGLDVLVTGSQKALMLPPGLCFISLSDRAWEKTKKAKLPRFYFDLNLERKNQQKGSGAFTPAVSLIFGVRASMQMIERGERNGARSQGQCHRDDNKAHRLVDDNRFKGPKTEHAEQERQRRRDAGRAERVRDDSRIAARDALTREIEAGDLQSRQEQREADAFGQRKRDHHRDRAEDAPARYRDDRRGEVAGFGPHRHAANGVRREYEIGQRRATQDSLP
jgi:aspartate aminotransferase-like enzyme